MRTEGINNTKFEGRLVLANNFSAKPKQSLQKSQNAIKELVRNNDYGLYLTQDYSKNAISIELKKVFEYKDYFRKKEIITDTGVVEYVDINSKPSRYVDAAKKAISDYETSVRKKKEEEYIKQARIDDCKAVLKFMAYAPLLVTGIALDVFVPGSTEKIMKNFNKAMKLVTKKG